MQLIINKQTNNKQQNNKTKVNINVYMFRLGY